MKDTQRTTPAYSLNPGWLADDMKRAAARVASNFSDWNDAVDACIGALPGGQVCDPQQIADSLRALKR